MSDRPAAFPTDSSSPIPSRASFAARVRSWFAAHGRSLAELAWISLWAIWLGRGLVNANRLLWPTGREFGSQIISHHFWIQLERCGSCALWDGMINGGFPALGDVFGSTLHPVVAVATLLLGVVNGAKASVVTALVMAGIAQWWISRTLGVGTVARVWSAMIVVAAGHLAPRLEGGAVGLLVSTGTASLAFAGAFALGIHPGRRLALLLGLLGAATLLAGQGYLQASLLGVSPAFLFLILDSSGRPKPVWREYALALGLSLGLSAVFLIPAIHFWPNWYKAVDPAFQASQPLPYVPLNLVINDPGYLAGTILGKLPYPYLYSLFIGWIPVIFAVLCLPLARRHDVRPLLCLASAASLALFLASGVPLRWLAPILPGLGGFRHAPLLAGLAVPALLGLSAYGLDRVLRLDWPRMALRSGGQGGAATRSISLVWLMALPLLVSLRAPMAMSQGYLKTGSEASIYGEIDALRTPSVQWVATPFGEHFWVEPALENGLKVANVVWAWNWKDRSLPAARLVANRGGPPPGTNPVGSLGDIPIYEDPGANYAAVLTATTAIPCQAAGSGGRLSVVCSTGQPGSLTVEENAWEGWRAWIDGSPASLGAGHWLNLAAPEGTHTYTFAYEPWDVPLGLGVTLASLALLLVLLIRSFSRTRPTPPGRVA
ncbi:MAG TPA: hypothetical protein VK449_09955 [Anaerolineales bacterium]|nr:hypothetical protein [Anaerolineales bacterium]